MTESENQGETRLTWKQAHPTVAFRVSKEERAHLDDKVRQTGKPLAELLRVGLGLVDRQLIDAKAQRQEGVEDGYGHFSIICAGCGYPLMLSMANPKVHALIKQTFKGWRHGGECPSTFDEAMDLVANVDDSIWE